MSRKNIILEPNKLFAYCPRCGSNHIDAHEVNAIKCKSCHFVYFFNASGAVIGIIVNAQGELLVTKRAFEPFKGKLDLPGGFIMPGESAEEALKREVREELNIEITSMKYCFTLPNKYPWSGMYVYTIDLVFEATVENFNPISAFDDVESFCFMKPSNIEPGAFGIESVRIAVTHYLNPIS
jgi:NAD+ diphosphatase